MPINENELKLKHDVELGGLRKTIKEKEGELDSYKKEHGRLEFYFRQVRETIEPVKPEKIIYKPKTEAKRVTTPCVAVMQCSDTHYGAVQVASEIEGFGEYNPEISKNRQFKFARSVIDWVELHRSDYIINDLHILDTGDNISGDIHSDLKRTNAWPTPVQAVKSGMVKAEQIAMMAPHFTNIYVHFIAADNHGRISAKPEAKEEGLNTHNYVVGEIAKSYLRDCKNVTFNLYPVYETVVKVGVRRYLLSHGHNVKGWAGFPWYGVERKIGKESAARLQIIMEDKNRADAVGFHKYIFGHWHTPIDLPLYSGAGSVSGTDAFDHKNGRHANPSQPAWLIHIKYGEFDRTNFTLGA